MLALAGPAWWHTSSVGHFVNSLHLWSVELFFFFMVDPPLGQVLHGRLAGPAALTWITGAVAFLVSIATAFTGYLTQQNFDSQWIAARPRTASTRPGSAPSSTSSTSARCCCGTSCCCRSWSAFLIGVHVLLRSAGAASCPPLPGRRRDGRVTTPPAIRSRRIRRSTWAGATRRYDLVKEAVLALVVVTRARRCVFAALFSSPDVKPVTIAAGRPPTPKDFLATARLRARRDERRRHLRAALHPLPGAGQN